MLVLGKNWKTRYSMVSEQKLPRSITKWTKACNKRLNRLISYIFFILVNTNNIVMWVILPNNADWDFFKTLILLEILKIRNPLLEEHCALLEVTHLFQSVGCVRNKLLFLTAQQNPKSSLWTLD